jgi:hypothetical protein
MDGVNSNSNLGGGVFYWTLGPLTIWFTSRKCTMASVDSLRQTLDCVVRGTPTHDPTVEEDLPSVPSRSYRDLFYRRAQ